MNAVVWAGLRRREIVSICLFLFTVDTVIGAISPILSLFAHSLGASLLLIGILATMTGVARFGAGVVIGGISDRLGRRKILLVSISLMGVAALLYAMTTSPYVLLLINALYGLSFVTSLTVGIAYAADISTPQERSLVFGLTTTSMGFGFALGSLLGGTLAGWWGYPSAYLFAAGVAVLGFGVMWLGVPADRGRDETARASKASWPQQMGVLLSNSFILAACFGTLLLNLIFGGLILTFFPIYADGLGIGQAAIGSMFATRTLASTLARLPAGVMGTIFPMHWVMVMALALATLVAFSLPQLTDPTLLTVLLTVEGVAFGLCLTSAQTTIASHADGSNRGAALGLYMAAASVGDSAAPIFLGWIAQMLGVKSVFVVVGSLVALGTVVMAAIIARARV